MHPVGNPRLFLDLGVVELDAGRGIDLQGLHRGHVALALDEHPQRHRIPGRDLGRLGRDAELEAADRAGKFCGAALLGQRQDLYLQFLALQTHRARAAKKVVEQAAAARALLGNVAGNGQRADCVGPRAGGKKGHPPQRRDIERHAGAHLLPRLELLGDKEVFGPEPDKGRQRVEADVVRLDAVEQVVGHGDLLPDIRSLVIGAGQHEDGRVCLTGGAASTGDDLDGNRLGLIGVAAYFESHRADGEGAGPLGIQGVR